MLNLKTLNDILSVIAASNRERAVLAQDASGSWNPISGAQIYQRVRSVAEALISWGIQKGDRIAILSENRWEWAVTDFATLALGAVDVPIYPTLTAEQTGCLLADSRSRIAVVSTRTQYEKVAQRRRHTGIERIVLMDESETEDAVSFSSLIHGADARGTARDSGFDRLACGIHPDDLATLIYTSGTTGEPKGVMLTHGNIASNINYSTNGFGMSQSDICISFLPLSHITARHLDYALYAQNVTIAYCSAFDKLPAAMTAVRPTVFVAVPRVYEKVREEAERRATPSPVKSRIFRWAIATGTRHRKDVAQGRTPSSLSWKLASALVYRKIAQAFGGRVRCFISGGAPLGLDTANWYAGIGLRILEGYGLTETSPVIAINSPKQGRMGSVGRPLPNVSCRIAEDGELLVSGPSIFHGYWKQPAHAPEFFDEQGYFRTGDIAHLDSDGFLYITDRKKELLKTSGGKLIAPAPIENKLKADPLIAQVALVGDRHKFASALIVPQFAILEAWSSQQGISAPTRRELVADPRVVARYQSIIERVNESLANFETIKRFHLVPDEWTLDSGELTPSLKLKRRVIAQKYAPEIAALYADEAVAHR
ncbi:MAG: long-chain fatty acid--CoA ligase [Silvibacterium sp.]|nr:long-chain fatty acid--CoA ligase [Silvibacterium sp.]